MKLCEIKNLTASELKERREELTKLAGGNDLATAFIQSLTDAKMRDEKLAEQGQTITAQAATIDMAQARIADLEATCRKLRDDNAVLQHKHNNDCAAHGEACGKLQASINELGSKLAAETSRANRLAALCQRSEKFINSVVAAGNELIAARTVETTNEG